MATNKTIITIGRQYGSGGHEIGATIAHDMGLKLYDKEMLKRAAKESGLCEELFETHDEKPTNSFLYSLVMDTYSLGYSSGGYADSASRRRNPYHGEHRSPHRPPDPPAPRTCSAQPSHRSPA